MRTGSALRRVASKSEVQAEYECVCVCVVMGRGRSFAFKLILRTGLQGHAYPLHRTHMGVPHVECVAPFIIYVEWCVLGGV
jgi:hypothetical protein